MTTVALFGAGGKMGVRLSRNLAKSDFDVRHIEVDPKGQLALLPEQIQALGRPGRIMSDPDEESAALLIEDTGLSGVRLRGARIGTRERNSLINLGGASAEDIWLVFQMIRDRVKLQTGHVLEVSIRRIGRGMK